MYIEISAAVAIYANKNVGINFSPRHDAFLMEQPSSGKPKIKGFKSVGSNKTKGPNSIVKIV